MQSYKKGEPIHTVGGRRVGPRARQQLCGHEIWRQQQATAPFLFLGGEFSFVLFRGFFVVFFLFFFHHLWTPTGGRDGGGGGVLWERDVLELRDTSWICFFNFPQNEVVRGISPIYAEGHRRVGALLHDLNDVQHVSAIGRRKRNVRRWPVLLQTLLTL